jgi:hypothetical protein
MLGKKNLLLAFIIVIGLFSLKSTCRFGTKDVSIPIDVKTFRVNIFQNKARIVNPLLAPRLSEKFRQKVTNQTRLRPTQANEPDWDINGQITDYSVTTSGVSAGQTANNRLTVAFHISMVDRLDDKRSIEADISKSYEFNAAKSISEAEQGLLDEMVRTLSDEIFNRIFSNW